MTTSRKLKKRVRERMARTGESYTKALWAVKAELAQQGVVDVESRDAVPEDEDGT